MEYLTGARIMIDQIKIAKERLVYENAYGRLFDDDVYFTSSNTEGRYVRWLWKAPYTIAVLPVLASGEIVLIESFRHSARKVTVEVPKGFGEEGVEPKEMARRELREEAGLMSSSLEYFGASVADPAFSYTPMHLFIAHECSPCESSYDSSEVIVGTRHIDLKKSENIFNLGLTDTTSLLLLAICQQQA